MAVCSPAHLLRASGGSLLLGALVLACAPTQAGPGNQTDAHGPKRGSGDVKQGESKRPQGSGPRGPAGSGPDRGPGEEAISVLVTRLEPSDLRRYYETSGTLRAPRSAEIVPLSAGIIARLFVEEGDQVKAGQVLAQLDTRDLGLQAERDASRAEHLQRELDRLQTLAGKNAVAREELDKQHYAVDEARSTARVTQYQAKQMTIRAPFAGTIVRRYVDVGNLATATTKLVGLADLSAVELDLFLPEREAHAIHQGREVLLELVDKTTFSAKVLRRAPVVDALTGTVKFTIRAEDRPAAAVPGGFVHAKVLVDERNKAPSLPRHAVFEHEGTSCVYVVRDEKATRVPVETGLSTASHIEIRSGLGSEDLVITDARTGIADGVAVRGSPAPTVAPPNAPG